MSRQPSSAAHDADVVTPAHGFRLSRAIGAALFAVVVLVWLALLAIKIVWLRHGGWQFDDSYMFFRYALHIRQGLGMSWNLDGVHTYGMTSLLWTWVMVPLTFLPGPISVRLSTASWIFAGLALAACSWAVWVNARSATLRRPLTVALLTCSTMLMLPLIAFAAVSGMETSLAVGLNCVLIGLVFLQARREVSPVWIGLVAWLLFLTRPESVLPVCLLLILAPLLLPGIRIRRAAVTLAILFAGIAVTLVWAKLYFHSWLPLPFYLKSLHPYKGYRARWYPVTSGLIFFRSCAVYLILLLCLTTRQNWRRLVLAAIPLAAVSLYLLTVTQIMGNHSRYSVPYLPLLAIPALLALDDRLAARANPGWGGTRFVFLLLAGAFLGGLLPDSVRAKLELRAEPRVLAYNPISYGPDTVPARPVLGYVPGVLNFTRAVQTLPRGVTVATTEVGYIGAAAPQLNLIDLAGLNDRQIALHGFDPAELVQRAPDIIFLPHFDYTDDRGILTTYPGFLQHYEFFADLYGYGVAVRKDSPYRSLAEDRLRTVLASVEPNVDMEKTRVNSVIWPAGTTVPVPQLPPM
jgi:hypothetical protein